MYRHLAGLTASLFVLAGTGHALAVPTHFNGNAYELILVDDPFVGNNNTWSSASAAAAASVYLGVSGHLVTIASQAEQDFVFGLTPATSLSAFLGAWIGGTGPGSWLVGPEAGQAMTYTNWNGPEPNNAGFAYMNIGTGNPALGAGKWFDDSLAGPTAQGQPHSGADPVIGYFVEYEGVSAVPLPPALALLGAGIGGLALLGRRKKYRQTA